MEHETPVDTHTLLDDARQKLIDTMDCILDSIANVSRHHGNHKNPIKVLHSSDSALSSVFLVSAEAPCSQEWAAHEDKVTAEELAGHNQLCLEKDRLVKKLVDAVVATKQVRVC